MAESKSLRILITGGAGFVGSHLCDSLISHGHQVICLDNLTTGNFDNIRPLINHPRFTFMEADVREPIALRSPLDRIYNLACAASPPQYQADPIGTLNTCVLGAQHVLNLARQTGARTLQASTSEVYGDPEQHPQRETYVGHVNPIGPRACYDEGKRAAETVFYDYNRLYGLPIKVARIFNTYGPRMLENDGRVVSNFITQALRDKPLTVYGDGRQTRSFCYVADMVRGLEALMESPEHLIQPCNLGNPHEIPVSEIAQMIIERTGSRSRIELRPLPKDDPKRRQPAVERARELLGWSPRIALEEGLRATIDYFTLRLAGEEARQGEPPLAYASSTTQPRSAKLSLLH